MLNGENNKLQKGRRCRICTGCGRCPGVQPQVGGNLKVITAAPQWMKPIDLKNAEDICLIAVDIGTTSIAMELCRADGTVRERYATVNPQLSYGRDVLSRITAAKDPEIRKELQKSVRSALVTGTERFLKCMESREKPVMVIAANTTMGYLFMGWDPEELGHAPFEASHLDGALTELRVNRPQEPEHSLSVPCVVLPGISAFVGGDILAGMIACELTEREEITLLVDLGTNGEIVLGNRDKVLACSSAAGPAFEGGAAQGVYGADMVHFAATLLENGLMDETGLLAPEVFESGIRIGGVLITQEAIRTLQMAKAAIYAGICILTRRYGIEPDRIDRVILAGGFGYFLNPSEAVKIGLLPVALEKKTVPGGNTALWGAKCAVSGRLTGDLEGQSGFLAGCRGLASKPEVLNLAMQDDFREIYMNSMQFSVM